MLFRSYNSDGSMTAVGPGFLADYHGTQWTNVDWRGNYRYSDAHTFSLGSHYDYNKLNSRVATINSGWSTSSTNDGVDSSVARGVTETRALWIQDAWKLSDFFKLTTGLRAESWHATDGYVFAAASGSKPAVSSNPAHLSYDALSPKLSMS